MFFLNNRQEEKRIISKNINNFENNNSDNELSFESVSSISKSNNSSLSLPNEDNKNIINNSEINHKQIFESKNTSLEINNKLNLTSLKVDSFTKERINIPILINNNINNYSILNLGQNKSINKSLLFLKSNYKLIKTYTSQGFNIKKRNFQNELLQLQNFKADSEQIWVAVLDSSHNFLATGGKSGVLKIWKMNSLTLSNIFSIKIQKLS